MTWTIRVNLDPRNILLVRPYTKSIRGNTHVNSKKRRKGKLHLPSQTYTQSCNVPPNYLAFYLTPSVRVFC
jgi:hypothetical protein